MRTLIILCCLLIFGGQAAFSQSKTIDAFRTNQKISIDGMLDEADWNNASSVSGFFGYYPVFGKDADQFSEVKILYDNHSVYFSAILYDANPDSIYTELTVRDKDNGNVDYFGISLNPNSDGQNTYEFIVSAANVQTDIRISDDNEDYNWDAVWHSAVRIVDNAWIVEIEIPYSAIRFPKTEDQNWSVNFFRTVRRSREKSSWIPVDQSLGSAASQMGLITGISKIDAPLRMSLMPYISGYYNSYNRNSGYAFSGGLDLKLGLSETYTLDMTLIPDFGQTKTDDLILNLTPHETYYSENRPFFTEGIELFNKCGLFYSRRIGKTPQDYYQIINESGEDTYAIDKNPTSAKLINAFKVSGRGKNNLAIGVFNAITANTYAKITDIDGDSRNVLTEPAANYNIIVLDQTVGKNSHLNFTNANVLRPGNAYVSNVSASSIKLMEKSNKFGITTLAAYSTQRNNSAYLADGWYLKSSLGKMTGKWVYSLSTEMITDNYNPNDLGYMTDFNQVSNTASVGYRRFSKFWIFNETRNTLSLKYNTLFEKMLFTKAEIHMSNYATTTRNHISFWNQLSWQPVPINDYYETRTADRFYKRPGILTEYFFMSTDYRRKLALDLRGGFYLDNEERRGAWANISPLMRFGKKALLRYTVSGDYDLGGAGYYRKNNDDIIFGRRDVLTFTNSINLDYVFTNKISAGIRARHYVSTVDYYMYYDLDNDGTLIERQDYNFDGDFNFNIFNIDLLFSWNFMPGSYLSIMWKNQIFASGIIPEAELMPSYYENFKSIWNESQANNFSLKLIYYLDYSSLKRR
jgi:hypothetical protein